MRNLIGRFLFHSRGGDWSPLYFLSQLLKADLSLPLGELSQKVTERENTLSAPVYTLGHLSQRERQVTFNLVTHDMLQAHFQDGAHMIIGQRIPQILAVPADFDQVHLLQ